MPFISNAALCNIFHQNSTNPIVTSIGFQFGYSFVTVMLHPKKRETSCCNLLTRKTFRANYTLSSFIKHFLIYVQLTIQLLFSRLHLE
ncbi:hypothetical protein COJ50_16435 [Bacillus cereus]|uniref:Uncharacterized protein n=1 Tax=Bacillus cereus TaxID=1396 RepID=A0A2B1KG25_BACCE|nr:hypothetical protein CN450_13190 [Bacillus cereus]PFN23820.1 hypothetical protein COJ50_16435 [Bacillus cereus]